MGTDGWGALRAAFAARYLGTRWAHRLPEWHALLDALAADGRFDPGAARLSAGWMVFVVPGHEGWVSMGLGETGGYVVAILRLGSLETIAEELSSLADVCDTLVRVLARARTELPTAASRTSRTDDDPG